MRAAILTELRKPLVIDEIELRHQPVTVTDQLFDLLFREFATPCKF